MTAGGVHFALTTEDERRLLAASRDRDIIAIIQGDIEERWDKDWLVESDKAWDAIHRCLTDGTLEVDHESTDRAKCILGGRSLVVSDQFWISYLTADEVRAVAAAIRDIDREALRGMYQALEQTDYEGPFGDGDFADTLSRFEDVRTFFARAADADRAVIFTVDQ